jgi:hypothetical protein
MSHLRSSIIIAFTQSSINSSTARAYELIFPVVTSFSFTTSSITDSQGWFNGTGAAVSWTVREEITTGGSIGTIDLSAGGVVTFSISPITLSPGDVLTIVPPASAGAAVGSAIGVSLIGER